MQMGVCVMVSTISNDVSVINWTKSEKLCALLGNTVETISHPYKCTREIILDDDCCTTRMSFNIIWMRMKNIINSEKECLLQIFILINIFCSIILMKFMQMLLNEHEILF